MAEIRFSLLKKIKIGRPEHLLIPTPYVQYLIFALLPSPFPPTYTHSHTLHPPQSGRHMFIIPLR